jgi:catechol 2,3-dioxygenase-like lactoylglutathione lyase family enzyme
MPIVKIDHVALAMPPGGEDRARSFYGGLLGFEEMRKPAELTGRGGVWFASADAHVHLGVDPDFRPAKKSHPAFRCSDYDSLLGRAKDHGVEIVQDDTLVGGAAHCYLTDPFGNRIELIAQR